MITMFDDCATTLADAQAERPYIVRVNIELYDYYVR